MELYTKFTIFLLLMKTINIQEILNVLKIYVQSQWRVLLFCPERVT